MTIDPKWRMLSPGLYDDGDGALHIDAVAYLEAAGYVPTSENQAMLLRCFEESGIPTTFTNEVQS